MKILLDECLPRKLSSLLSEHEVKTVQQMGCSGKKNGELLSLMAGKFDVFITLDKHIPDQQNLIKYSVGIIILQAKSNRIEDIEPLVPDMLTAIRQVKPHHVLTLTLKRS